MQMQLTASPLIIRSTNDSDGIIMGSPPCYDIIIRGFSPRVQVVWMFEIRILQASSLWLMGISARARVANQ